MEDIFVLPTRVEGFPVALVEAMGAGVVPVVSNIESGVPEVIASARTGERPPVGDIRAFAAAIAALDRDRPRLAAMGAAARQSIVERFGSNVRNSQSVAGDASGTAHKCFNRARSIRQRPVHIPVQNRQREHRRHCD